LKLAQIDLLDENIGVDETLGEDEWLSGGEEEYETISEDECLSGGKEEGYEFISGEECISGGEEETVSEMEDGFAPNQEAHSMASDLSSEESLESVDHQEAVSFGQQRMAALKASDAKGEIVKTSAVMGVGLHELLHVIDKKLSEQKTIVTRSLGPFDRKWRPSSSTEPEKVARK